MKQYPHSEAHDRDQIALDEYHADQERFRTLDAPPYVPADHGPKINCTLTPEESRQLAERIWQGWLDREHYR